MKHIETFAEFIDYLNAFGLGAEESEKTPYIITNHYNTIMDRRRKFCYVECNRFYGMNQWFVVVHNNINLVSQEDYEQFNEMLSEAKDFCDTVNAFHQERGMY